MYGFKWRETRDVLGKEIRETMIITECIEYSYYHTHSESYGSIYTCIVSVIPEAKGTKLVLSFDSAAQTPLAKIISFFFSSMLRKLIHKEITKDLEDIKRYLESKKLNINKTKLNISANM